MWLSFLTGKLPSEHKDETNLTIYGGLVAASFILGMIRAYIFFLICLRCSERLHDKMVVALLKAPVFFFDSNPVGRILNRFSKDVGCMDELLPRQFLSTIQWVLMLLSSVVIPSAQYKSLAFVCHRSSDGHDALLRKILLEEFQRTKKVGVNMSKPSFLSHIRDS